MAMVLSDHMMNLTNFGKNMDKIFVPPIKCQGIKTKLVPWIKESIPFHFKARWIEPFMGSGVVGFNTANKDAIFADVNPYSIEFYNALKFKKITPNKAKDFLSKEGENLFKKGEKYYYYIRDRFNRDHNPLDFLFLSRSCFNGLMRFNKAGEFNVPFCRKPERFSKAYITKIVNQIEYVYSKLQTTNWEFISLSFHDLIIKAKENDLIYCDPPYLGRHVDYYNSWGIEEEQELAGLLKKTKARFILSTWLKNDFRVNEAISLLWGEHNIITKSHYYHVGGKIENRNPVVEALITNFDLVSYPKRETVKELSLAYL